MKHKPPAQKVKLRALPKTQQVQIPLHGWRVFYAHKLYAEVAGFLSKGAFDFPDGAYAYHPDKAMWAARRTCSWTIVPETEIPNETRALALLFT